MNYMRKLASGLVVLMVLHPVLAQTKDANPNGKNKRNQAMPPNSAEISHGQMVFEQNCSRCHNAPQGFPPQISATIIRHMRVRASLSVNDEKALLRFMNP